MIIYVFGDNNKEKIRFTNNMTNIDKINQKVIFLDDDCILKLTSTLSSSQLLDWVEYFNVYFVFQCSKEVENLFFNMINDRFIDDDIVKICIYLMDPQKFFVDNDEENIEKTIDDSLFVRHLIKVKDQLMATGNGFYLLSSFSKKYFLDEQYINLDETRLFPDFQIPEDFGSFIGQIFPYDNNNEQQKMDIYNMIESCVV